MAFCVVHAQPFLLAFAFFLSLLMVSDLLKIEVKKKKVFITNKTRKSSNLFSFKDLLPVWILEVKVIIFIRCLFVRLEGD